MTELQQLRMKLHQRVILAMRRSGWQHTYDGAVRHVKRAYLQRVFDVDSSTALGDEELRLAINSWTFSIKLEPPTDKHYALPTAAELKKIVRLGKYKLGAVYGQDWFWRHLPEWTRNYYEQVDNTVYPARTCTALNQLSAYEAEHVIRILEQIEKKVQEARA